MENKKLIAKGVTHGIGTAFVVFVISKTFDKKLATVMTIKSALVLIASVTLASLGVDYAEEKGYFV